MSKCLPDYISINRLFEPTYRMFESLMSIQTMLPKMFCKTPVCLKINIFHFFFSFFFSIFFFIFFSFFHFFSFFLFFPCLNLYIYVGGCVPCPGGLHGPGVYRAGAGPQHARIPTAPQHTGETTGTNGLRYC